MPQRKYRQPPEKPLHKEMAKFVEAHLGKGIFAPFTSTDFAAWRAWCELLRLYGSTRDTKAIDALRATLECAQRKECIWQVFVQTIPGALDWDFVKVLWPRIVGPILPTMRPRELEQPEFAEVMYAVERGEGNTIYRKHGAGWK